VNPSETVEKVETFHFYYSGTVRNQLLMRQRKRLIHGFKGFSTVSPVLVIFENPPPIQHFKAKSLTIYQADDGH
jgi:hypothetical protein